MKIIIGAVLFILGIVGYFYMDGLNKELMMHPNSELGYTISTSKDKIEIGPGYSNREIWLFGSNLTIFIQGQNCTTRIAID